jgi:hypothetical protein
VDDGWLTMSCLETAGKEYAEADRCREHRAALLRGE